MSPIQTQITDERSIQVPIPASDGDLSEFAGFVDDSRDAGYALTGARTIQGGNQRDPYTTGLKLVFTKDHS